MQDLVGKTVRLDIVGIPHQDPYIRPKVESGEQIITLVAQVDSVDQMGIWIRQEGFPVYNSMERKKEAHTALMLIRYDYISSIVHFPEVEEDDSKQKRIGFIAEEDF